MALVDCAAADSGTCPWVVVTVYSGATATAGRTWRYWPDVNVIEWARPEPPLLPRISCFVEERPPSWARRNHRPLPRIAPVVPGLELRRLRASTGLARGRA